MSDGQFRLEGMQQNMKKPHPPDFTTCVLMALVVDQAKLDEAHARNRVLIAALAKAHGVSMVPPDGGSYMNAPLLSAPEIKKAAEGLLMSFCGTVEWRRQKSAEYPDDKRNLDAAETIEKIMKTIDQIEPNTLAAYVELFEDSPDSELHSELLRGIGFIWEPENATEFVQAFIERSTS